MKKRGVGIVVVVEIDKILYAVLQRRGTFNTEKMASESFPGCLQVTCHGGLKDDEDFQEGLIREATEELGSKFTYLCQSDVELTEMERVITEEKETVTYGAIIPAERLKLIRLGPDTGGLELLTKEKADGLLCPISKDMKANGPPPGTYAMFQDEIDAVKKAFRLFEKAGGAQKS